MHVQDACTLGRMASAILKQLVSRYKVDAYSRGWFRPAPGTEYIQVYII